MGVAEVEGTEPKSNERILEIGIETAREITYASAEALSQLLDVSEEMATEFIKKAAHLLEKRK